MKARTTSFSSAKTVCTAILFIGGLLPAWAEDPPPLVQKAIEALIAGRYVENFCPTYRQNLSATTSLIIAAGIQKEDFVGRYSDFMQTTADRAKSHVGLTDKQFCDFLFDFYQEGPSNQHIIEKR